MKKKGFTLVELLAVIAILAILVVIALPNVMGMFNSAKKDSFTTEVKNTMRVLEQDWLSKSLANSGSGSVICFTNVANFNYKQKGNSTAASKTAQATCGSGTSVYEASIKARTNMKYFFKTDAAGKITNLFMTDGEFYVALKGTNLTANDVKSSIVKSGNLALGDENEVCNGKADATACSSAITAGYYFQ